MFSFSFSFGFLTIKSGFNFNIYKMKKTILSVFAFALSAVAFAQVGGTVSDDQNNPLPGASVVIKGTTTGATTDFDGAFSIDAK
jgi:iron complex outermembrane recepter protein